MTLRGDSFSSIADVLALSKHLLSGQATFNSTTTPTLTETEGIIDEVSGIMNVALSNAGFTPSAIRANSTAILPCDSWVRFNSVALVELANPVQGIGEDEDRSDVLGGIYESATEFVEENTEGWINLGIPQTTKESAGISFTGLTVQADRSDPDNTSYEQPKFKRGLFDNK